MGIPRYEITPDENTCLFTFISEGKKGSIEKVVLYEEMETEGFFNLGFGDRDPITGYLDDEAVSDNGDTQRVLTTVATTLFYFTKEHPDAFVYAKGGTPARNRLYRRKITKYLKIAQQDFNVYGILPSGEIVSFVPNTEYIGFLIQRKKE
ncbi:hypothetical protein J4N46_01585 [Capnocytophaga sp. Marseille-Q4570]|jgi:hypothetical protein|uniref:Uncharacterized protein n=1 Tax=Capnocytophaga bilenii TaxID=2819369 RepID=A0ABS3PV30_9FLAO|nr:hypothetical protein [Capnocytophaga bilenii]MBO1883150.1 hypothetical protein [Capnocytophaga bilenii]